MPDISMIATCGFDSSGSVRVTDPKSLCDFLSSRMRKERCGGSEHLRPLTGVVYISKSCDLLDHGCKETKTERSDVAVAVCPRIQSS